ncbi:hypothetical protein RhiirA1_542425 [Rhizophagus irregularis]|uniref:Uncharacterized protein n=1 Tax=Rhizophagus irregularis TaxID=588596 RepID=A0A2N0QX79_9GLOM|nr:hypothetical protein RhiirA1_542425 [Rhizophagus irregularis]
MTFILDIRDPDNMPVDYSIKIELPTCTQLKDTEQTSLKSGVNISPISRLMPKTNPTYNQSYFYNKILDQYLNLYRKCNCENFDYYGITDETSCGNYICPLCKLGHDDEKIEEHFPYLKFGNSFRGIDNYNFTSLQPWNSPCPICDGKHGNYGLYGSWYCENGNQLPYDPELAKLYSQDKLEYCLTCNTSSKLKFTIVA